MNENENIRHEQAKEGRRMSDETVSRPRPTITKPKKRDVPTGHEAFLKALETNQSIVRIDFLDGADPATGTIRHSDKFTISLRVIINISGGTEDRVIFKHSIRQFVPLTPPPVRD